MKAKSEYPPLHADQHLPWGSDPLDGLIVAPTDEFADDWPLLITALADIRGYWRLGETAGPFLDTSGFVGTPADLTYHTGNVGSTAPTFDITPGLLPPATDDGAIGFNHQGNTSSGSAQRAHLADDTASASARFDFSTTDPFTVVALVKPYTPGATAFVGGIVSYVKTTGTLDGWGMHMNYPSMQPEFFRGVNPSAMTTVTAPAVTAGAQHTLVATYDGTTSRLYVDGALAASSADANTVATPVSSHRIRVGGYDPLRPSFGDWRPFYGVIDEVAVYGTVLSAAEVAALHDAASDIPVSNEGKVAIADGAGGTTWDYPLEVTF